MDQNTILNNIKLNSKSELDDLSDNDLDLLLKTTIQTIDSVLENGSSVEINDFGTFSRRKQDKVSVSFFRPAERLSDRISRKR